jgi:DNA-binding IclR family transcriptional regulator
VSTYSLGRKSFSIGQVYVNIESSIKQMKLRVKEISEELGEKFGCA